MLPIIGKRQSLLIQNPGNISDNFYYRNLYKSCAYHLNLGLSFEFTAQREPMKEGVRPMKL